MPTLKKTFFRPYFSTLSMVLILFLPAQMPVKAAGEIDPTFNAGAFWQSRGSLSASAIASARTVVVQPDGKILIGGYFEVVSGFSDILWFA